MSSPSNALISLSELRYLGEGLRRPESILATARGELFVSDHVEGVREVRVPPRPLVGKPPGFLPNGFAMTRERDFLVANLAGVGGVWRIDAQYQASPFIMEVEGEKLSTTNFVGVDHRERIWISMSTRQLPRERAFNPRTRDGFIALVDRDGARIVADGIGFTNECRVSPDGQWLHVNETYQRRLTRFPIHEVAGRTELGKGETVFEFRDGDFPDGLAFDSTGAVWVACIISNRVLRIEGARAQIVVEDPDPELCARAEASFATTGLDRAGVDAGGQRALRNVSSIAFGGPDLRTVYLGCLAGDRIATFRSPVPGAAPAHWNY